MRKANEHSEGSSSPGMATSTHELRSSHRAEPSQGDAPPYEQLGKRRASPAPLPEERPVKRRVTPEGLFVLPASPPHFDANFPHQDTSQASRTPEEAPAESHDHCDDDCRCNSGPPDAKRRNLVVCIDGTANQFGLKVR